MYTISDKTTSNRTTGCHRTIFTVASQTKVILSYSLLWWERDRKGMNLWFPHFPGNLIPFSIPPCQFEAQLKHLYRRKSLYESVVWFWFKRFFSDFRRLLQWLGVDISICNESAFSTRIWCRGSSTSPLQSNIKTINTRGWLWSSHAIIQRIISSLCISPD